MAIEVIAKIKQKNNGIFKLIDSCDVEMANGQDLQSYIEALELGEFPSLENLNLIYVHNEELTEEQIEKHELFIDKSATVQEASNKIDNVFLEEIRGMFNSLQKTIDEQQKTIVDLKMRIDYLESLHNTIEPDEPTTNNMAILLENGGYLSLEDGGKLIIEEASKEEIVTTNGLLLENDGYFLLENGGVLLLEGSVVKDTTTRKLLTESGKLFLLENGGSFLLENSYIEIEQGEVVVKLESGGDLLLENGGKLLMELSEEEYNLLLENGKILLTEKNGKIILDKE